MVTAAFALDLRGWDGKWNARFWRKVHATRLCDEVKIAFLVLKVNAFSPAFHFFGRRQMFFNMWQMFFKIYKINILLKFANRAHRSHRRGTWRPERRAAVFAAAHAGPHPPAAAQAAAQPGERNDPISRLAVPSLFFSARFLKCSLDCVWQALGVEHVSLHSSLASHSAGSYNFSF